MLSSLNLAVSISFEGGAKLIASGTNSTVTFSLPVNVSSATITDTQISLLDVSYSIGSISYQCASFNWSEIDLSIDVVDFNCSLVENPGITYESTSESSTRRRTPSTTAAVVKPINTTPEPIKIVDNNNGTIDTNAEINETKLPKDMGNEASVDISVESETPLKQNNAEVVWMLILSIIAVVLVGIYVLFGFLRR